MPIKYRVSKSGGGELSRAFTVVFDTSRMTEQDATTLCEKSSLLTESQEIGSDIERKADLFVRNGKAVAIVRYDASGANASYIEDDLVEEDFQGLVKQLADLIHVFEGKNQT